MDRTTRAGLKKTLSEAGVPAPESASISQLKNLLTSVQTADQIPLQIPRESPVSEDEVVIPCALLSASEHVSAGGESRAASQDIIASLDADLAILRKQLEIKKLRQQLAELEMDSVTNQIPRPSFTDLESALPVFSGDDITLGVRDFLADFESVIDLCRVDDRNKLPWLRRSLQGTARIFLSTTSGLSYGELKDALIAEFGSGVKRHVVYQKLAHRHWVPDRESIHAYILTMQSMAKQCHIDDAEVLQFILEGLQGKVGHLELLMSARTTTELKKLVERYQGSKLMLPQLSETPQQPSQRNSVQRSSVTSRSAPRGSVQQPSAPQLFRATVLRSKVFRSTHAYVEAASGGSVSGISAVL